MVFDLGRADFYIAEAGYGWSAAGSSMIRAD